ncbi:Fimbriae usher protein StcC (plasmid) [Klebsiella aerogenes]|nr:Fimbriae usher protein StcC [Klebsiella aerogenes]
MHSDATYSKADSGGGDWKSNTLYLERSFAPILGTLRAGDMYTSADIFDAVRFRGVRLFRDMQMLPNSKQNFTPIVQGIAQSNALVTIEQNGFTVYQKEVPPGLLRLPIYNSPAAGGSRCHYPGSRRLGNHLPGALFLGTQYVAAGGV